MKPVEEKIYCKYVSWRDTMVRKIRQEIEPN